MELDEASGSEKYIPSHNFLLLPAALGRGMAGWRWHWGSIHSFHSFCIYLFMWPFLPTCLSFPPACRQSLPITSKGNFWPHHSSAACPLWSSLSISVNGDNDSSYLRGELGSSLNSSSTSQTRFDHTPQ